MIGKRIKSDGYSIGHIFQFIAFVFLAICASMPATNALAQVAPPNFTKTFTPDTIGPGSTTTLRFDITNADTSPVTALAFSDTLPAGVTIATPANATLANCGSPTLSAPDGGGTISFSGGQVAALSSCVITVNVTSSTAGTHTNVTGDLTSSAGNSGSATDDLTVAVDRPAFSKSFSPGTVSLGGKSTLTFTIDNTANASAMFQMLFTDNLPTGLAVASPSNAVSNCNNVFTGVLTAVSGSSVISHSSGGVAAGASCTIVVDVVGGAVGTHYNVSGDLTSTSGGPTVNSGKATDILTVTGGSLLITKAFTNDPVAPGGTVNLEFTIQNNDRSAAASDVAFTDDLDATLSGLVATGLPANDVCGAGSQISGTSLISLTGGSLAAGASCTFAVTLQVPAGAATGSYPNTTSTVTGNIGAGAVVGNQATDTLRVEDALPMLAKAFQTNPVAGGDTVDVQFTITNPSATQTLTNLAFNDNISGFLSGATITGLPAAGFCGAGSFAGFSGDLNLVVGGANLAPGIACTFTVELTIPVGAPPGSYLNTTSQITGTANAATVTGPAASDTLDVVGGLQFSKEFTDDPAAPGGTATLEFTITNPVDNPADATSISFTDDLNATLSGLVATGLPASNVCGAGSQISGTTNLSFTGGTLAPGASCTFSVTTQVPAGAAPGDYLNTTSNISATVSGLSVTDVPATDTLSVGGMTFTKEFTDDPVIAGDNVTLRFTIDNTGGSAASAIAFTDDLRNVLPGAPDLTVAGGTGAVCGGTLTEAPTGFLSFSGGSVAAASSCSFDVTLTVPGGTADGSYGNVTSNLTATYGAAGIIIAPATDTLEVSSAALLFSKEFTDDPIVAGNTGTLEFTIENPTGQAATALTFTDDLDAALSGLAATGLPVNDVCGAGSQISGTSLLTLTGGSIGPGSSCTFTVSFVVPGAAATGSYTNTTSLLSGTINALAVTGNSATDDLQVLSATGPTFTKAFDGPSVPGGAPLLTFTVTNNDPTTALVGFGFTDDLNAVLSGLAATGFPTNSCGGTASGTTLMTYAGGTLAPSASCTIVASLSVPGAATAGTYPNTTSDLSSGGLVVAAPATASLTIEPPPSFAKIFAPDTILFGGVSTLTFTVDNSASALAASALDFTDNLPAGVTVATPANASTTCTGGAITAASGAGVISYTGGTVAAGASCTIQADVTSSAPGAHVNVTGDLTSSSGNSGTATDTLTVSAQPPLFSKLFSPDAIQTNAFSILTFTIDNTAAGVAATGLDFTDNMPAAIVVATGGRSNTTCTGGTLTAVAGTNAISYTGGSVAAGATCLINVEVQGIVAGAHSNTTGDLTSSLGNSGTASDDLNVTDLPPVFTKLFAPDTIGAGAVSTLTFTINNTVATISATALDFTDNLPAAITVASPANASTTCTGGTLTAASGSSVISYTGGTVAASAICTISVDVTSVTSGSHVNLTGDLTSSLGNSGKATDTLNVNFVLPGFTKQFAPNPIVINTVTTLTFTIDNTGSLVDATAVDFTDNMPAAITVATPSNASTTCTGGTLTAASGSSTISYTGGAASASASCTVAVDVTSATAGAHVNVTGDLTSSLGNSGTATDTLTVDLPLGTITIVKNTAPVAAGDGTFEFTSTDPDFDAISLTTVANTATSAPFAKAAGVYPVTEDITTGWVLDTIACVGDTDGGSVIDIPSRTVDIDIDNGETIVCTFTNIRDANAVIQQTRQAIMEFMEHRADQMTANQPDLASRLRDRGVPGLAPLEFAGSGTLASSTSRFSTSLHKVKSWHSNLNGEDTGDIPTFDIWMQGFFSHTNTDSSKSHLGMLHLGADYLINPDLVVGGIVQLDWAGWDSSTNVATVDGFGWMAGPYFVANPWQNIYIDGRVAYGQSYNKINPIGTYTDRFDTDRFLASLQITGDMKFGSLNVNPAAELLYFNERQKTYIDTLGNTIPSQTLELGRMIFGPQFSYDMVLDNGATLSPSAKFEGIWDFHSKTTPLATGSVETVGGLRGRVDLGLGYRTPAGFSMKASGFYDGIGKSGFEAYGGELEFVVPLQPEE